MNFHSFNCQYNHETNYKMQNIIASITCSKTPVHMQTWKDMLKACKWNQVPVFTQPEHKQRVTLSISIELLNKIVIHTMNNKPKLIPIVMFDDTAHWMEYICVVHIQKDMDIGIAIKY
eukprot:376922_1